MERMEKGCDGRIDCMCDHCQANHFKRLWEDALCSAAELFFLAEYLWGTCAERRDRKAFLNIMARAERDCLTRDFLEERRRNTLAGQLKPDFNPRTAFAELLKSRSHETMPASPRR